MCIGLQLIFNRNVLKLVVVLTFISATVFCFWSFFVPSIRVDKVNIMGEETYKYSGRMRCYFWYETPVSLKTFKRYSQKKGWKYVPITKPFKIKRYTIIQGHFRKDYDGLQKIEVAAPADELNDSYYHFVSNGFYYIEEDAYHTLHVAYDLHNGMPYYYLRTAHGGGDTQKIINPLWK